MELLLPIIILLVTVVYGSCFVFRHSHSKLPPGPFSFPVIGSLHRLGPLPHVSLHNLARKYGDLMHLRLGSVSTVIVSSEKAARDVFRLYKLECASKFPFISSEYFKGIVFSGYSPQVIFHRKLINTHLLSVARLKVYEGNRREEQRQFIRWIRDTRGKPFLLKQKIQDVNMSNITHMLFGKRYKSIENLDELMNNVIETLKVCGFFNISDYIPGLRWLDVQGLEKKYKQLMNKVNPPLMSIIEERRRRFPPADSPTSDEPMPFIDVLISMDSTEEKMTDNIKTSLLFDLLLGAVQTSAVTIEWAMAELIRHPHEFSIAREQIDGVVGKKRLVDESDISKLPYIEAIAKETMRIHMAAPLPSPKIVEGGPLQLNGYTIPNGAMLLLNSYAISQDENRWDKPSKFCPQRFMDSKVDIFGQNYELLPFGTGRRVCPGAKLAFDIVQINIAQLVHGFDWQLEAGDDPADMNMEEVYGPVGHKAQPLVAIPSPRLAHDAY